MNPSKTPTSEAGQVIRNEDSATALSVRSGNEINQAPSDGAQLLLGFEFGCSTSPPVNEGIVRLALEPLTAASGSESWWYTGAVQHRHMGPVRMAECEHFSALIVELDEAGQSDFKALSQQAYLHLFEALKTARHNKPVRIWNYFDRINEEQNQQERYRSFSSGRAAAFAQFDIFDSIAPVGTAIGTTNSKKLILVALATDLPFEVMENPRQVSAYHYPKSYGPDSPKFSRCGLLRQPSGSLFLVSGTASVVGHDSTHPFDSSQQLQETLRNLTKLLEQVQPQDRHTGSSKPDPDTVLRVYLRNPEDQALVENLLQEAWGDLPLHLMFLQGDICRSELMIEIEAVSEFGLD